MINADTSAYCIALNQSECLISLMSVLIEYKNNWGKVYTWDAAERYKQLRVIISITIYRL